MKEICSQHTIKFWISSVEKLCKKEHSLIMSFSRHLFLEFYHYKMMRCQP